jgi:hypothetical protein
MASRGTGKWGVSRDRHDPQKGEEASPMPSTSHSSAQLAGSTARAALCQA